MKSIRRHKTNYNYCMMEGVEETVAGILAGVVVGLTANLLAQNLVYQIHEHQHNIF